MSKDKEEKNVPASEPIADTDNVTGSAPASNAAEEPDDTQAADAAASEELSPEEALQNQVKSLEEQLAKEKKDYLFLMAEFDNFRKRTLKEKSEIIKNGAENAMREILPIIDDFERALQAIDQNSDIDGLKEGVELIYNKFVKYLDKNGVKAIDTTDKEFDTELHEAVTTFPTDDDSKKGKVIDTVQKGYTINDKVLRHAKVVVGQ